jgi:hypothetical protein
MLKIGDKIKYVNTNSLMEFPLGTIFEVKDIKGTALAVSGKYKANGMTVGYIEGIMSYDEYEKYFEKYVEEEKTEKKNPWSEWKEVNFDNVCDSACGCETCPLSYCCNNLDYCDVLYKTNNKRIIVKYTTNGKVIKSHSTCHETDTFDLNTGLRVALARLFVKIAEEDLKTYIESL